METKFTHQHEQFPTDFLSGRNTTITGGVYNKDEEMFVQMPYTL